MLLWGKRISWIPELDVACVKTFTNAQDLIYDFNSETNTISQHTLMKQPDRSRNFQMILVTDDPDRIFEHTPPTPLDYAIVLQSLRNMGYKRVILSTRMTWDEQPGLEASSLSDRLALFENSAIGLPVTRGATAQPLPESLQRSLIPLSQVKGNHQLIPIVNRVSLPVHAGGGKNTLAGFNQIESSPASSGNIPMLANWEGKGLIPSLELLSIMIAHDVTPSQLIIHSGKHLRFGKKGLIIPLDDYGQTTAPQLNQTDDTSPQAKDLKAEDLITQKPDSSSAEQPQICLIQAVGKKTSATSLLSPHRIDELIHLTKNLPMPGKTTDFRRLPQWAEIVIIIDIALLAGWFAGFSAGNRRLALLLTAAFLFPMLFAFIDITQHWFAISAPLATVIVAWLIPVSHNQQNRKQTDSFGEYSSSAPKPVSRG